MTELQTTLDRMARAIRATENHNHKRDLLKLYRSCENIIFEITNEMVECRRRNIKSAKLNQLELSLENAIETFDQWLTFSRLLG
jgi:hypothetical protein